MNNRLLDVDRRCAARWLHERDQARSMLDTFAATVREMLEAATAAGQAVDPRLHAALARYALQEGHTPTLLALGLIEPHNPDGARLLQKAQTIAAPSGEA